MKILLCVPFPLDDPKGNSVAAKRLAEGFATHGNQVEIFVPTAQGNPAMAAERALAARPDVVLFMHAWRCAPAARAIRQAALRPGFGALEPRVLQGSPGQAERSLQVVSLRGTDANEMLDDPATRDELAAELDASDGIVVFHSGMAEQLAARNPDWQARTFIIPNGATLPVSRVDFRSRLGIPPGSLVFGSVAGLREVKRPLLVLPWLEKLREKIPDLVWLHAGPPLESAVAETLSRFAQERPWVYHVDHVPHGEIDSFYRAMDVFVASSRSEGMPNAVREAMLAGKPLVLSRIAGHRNIATEGREARFFTDESGFLVAARSLAENPVERDRLGQAARTRVVTELAAGDEVGAYLALFAALRQKGNTDDGKDG